MSTSTAKRREITGRHVLFALIAFFGVVFALNAVMVYLAVSTFGGLETKDAYRRGLAYNARIEAERAQDELGWTPKLQLDARTGRLSVGVVGRDGQPVRGLAVVSELGRPATNRFDRTLALTETAPGQYEAEVGQLEAGTWSVNLTARRGQHDAIVYQAKARLWQQGS